jgi:hypothetical protein
MTEQMPSRACLQVHQLGCSTLAVDPGSRFLITGGDDRLLKAWPLLPRPQAQFSHLSPKAQSFVGHSDAVHGVALLGDTAVSVCEGGCVLVWDVMLQQQADDAPQQQQEQQQEQQEATGGAMPKGWSTPGVDGLVLELANLRRDSGAPAPDSKRQDQWRIRAARPGSTSPTPAVPPQVRALRY